MGLTYSPIHRGIANIEYLLWLTIDQNSQVDALGAHMPFEQTTTEIVEAAHRRK